MLLQESVDVLNLLPGASRDAPLAGAIDGLREAPLSGGHGVDDGNLALELLLVGRIVECCHEVCEGRVPEVPEQFDLPAGQNVKLVDAETDDEIVASVVAAMQGLRASGEFDLGNDVQVIVGTNVVREILNVELQHAFNPQGDHAVGNPFRVGDKIVANKNGQMPNAGGQGQLYIANGEMGTVVAVSRKWTEAEFAGPPRRVRIPRDDTSSFEPGCSFDLGYAVTVHKAQGSEWRRVIAAMPSRSESKIVSREWLYTSLSRAQEACTLVGQQEVLKALVERPYIDRRQTHLVELLEPKAGMGNLIQMSGVEATYRPA